MSARASYDLKLDRAEHHLNKLERAITRFSDRHPYRVREQMNQQGDFKLYFLEFTEDPPENIALIIGDFLYNTRGCARSHRWAIGSEQAPRPRELPGSVARRLGSER